MKIDREFFARLLPGFCLLVFGLAATVGAFTGGIWASFGIGLALILFFSVWSIERCLPKPEARLVLFIFVLLGYCAVLNLRSTQPQLSWLTWEKLATIFLPLSLLTAPAIQKRATSPALLWLLPLAVTLGALAIGLELFLQGPLLKLVHPGALIVQYNRGFSYLVILAFPAMAALVMGRRPQAVLPLLLILFLPASLTESRAAKLALMLGFATVVLTYFVPAAMRRLLIAVPFLACGWPFAAQKIFLAQYDRIQHLPVSWLDRMEIWDYMSYRILEHPWLGWGLGASSRLSPAKPHGELYHWELSAVAHPHNAVTQLWVELGLPGLFFGIVFALLVLHRAGRLKPALIPFALGAWMAAFCLSMIAYDFWSDSLWAAFALTGFAFSLLQLQTGKPRS